jgi:hypothetical protein
VYQDAELELDHLGFALRLDTPPLRPLPLTREGWDDEGEYVP